MGDERRITQLLAEIDQEQDTDRRITQVLAEVDQDATEERRATQLLLEVDYLEELLPTAPVVPIPSHHQSRALTISIWHPDIAWTEG